MKNLIKILTLTIICFGISINCVFAADSDIAASVQGKISFYTGLLTGEINKDTKAQVDSLKDEVNSISNYNLKVELMQKVTDLSNKMADIISGADINRIQNEFKIVAENSKLYVVVPNYIRYTYHVRVIDAKYDVNMISTKAYANDKIALPAIKENLQWKIVVDLFLGNEYKKTVQKTGSFYDSSAPTIKGIYVLNNYLKINAVDNYKLAERPYVFKIGEEITESEDSIKIDKYPTVVEVYVVDSFGNKSSKVTVNVTENSKTYAGSVGEDDQTELNSDRKSKYSLHYMYNNIAIGQVDKEINYIDAFSQYYKTKLGSKYNKENLKLYYTNLKKGYAPNTVIFAEGINSLELRYENTSIIVYLVAPDKSGFYNVEYSGVRNALPSYMNTNSLYLGNYLALTPNDPSKTYVSDKFILVMYGDKAYRISGSLTLEYDTVNVVNILCFATGEVIENEIMCNKMVSTTETINDIQKHWAKSSIISMVQKNVVKGYEDKTFLPDYTVTVKEFLAMLNRLNPNKARETLNPSYIGIYNDDWAYYEVKNVLSKIDYNIIANSGLMQKFDQPITREEVAFLISNYYKLPTKESYGYYKDLAQSKYSSDFQKVIANGIMKGYIDSTVKPKNNLTRAEATVILGRVYGK